MRRRRDGADFLTWIFFIYWFLVWSSLIKKLHKFFQLFIKISRNVINDFFEIIIWMSINLNMRINSINTFRLFRVNFASSALNLIDTSANCNIKVNSTEFFRSLCVNDSSFNNSVNLFCNVDNNLIFNDKIFS